MSEQARREAAESGTPSGAECAPPRLAKESEDRFGQAVNSAGWRMLDRCRSLRNHILSHPLTGWFSKRRSCEIIDGSDYRRWIARTEQIECHPDYLRAKMADFRYQPLVSVLAAVWNTPQVYLEKTVCSLQEQIYPAWELCLCDDGTGAPQTRAFLEACSLRDSRVKVVSSAQAAGISAALNAALARAEGEFVGLLDPGDELSPAALFHVINLLQQHPEADFIYSDEDKLDPNGGRCEPFFKPDWSPEYLLALKYTGHFGVYRRSLMEAIGAFRQGFEGGQDYDLVLRITERTGKVFHLPHILYHGRNISASAAASAPAGPSASDAGRRALQEHMQRRGTEAVVIEAEPNRYRVRPRIQGKPLVSIIVPTKDGVSLLRRCLGSIQAKTEYSNYEVLIVDNNSAEPATRQFFASLPCRVISAPGPFNFARINNLAVQNVKGEYLLFLNNDTEVIAAEWLTALLEFCQLPEIGVVGAKLLYPNRTIQHAGVLLGLGGIAGHCYRWHPEKSRGYFDSLSRTRNYSAVTAACCMIRRAVFEQVNGFDEGLPVAFGDVDLCLRVRDAGYRIVYSPYALLYHHESVSRGHGLDPRDVSAIRSRWGDALTRDPFYNPNLSLHAAYRLDR